MATMSLEHERQCRLQQLYKSMVRLLPSSAYPVSYICHAVVSALVRMN